MAYIKIVKALSLINHEIRDFPYTLIVARVIKPFKIGQGSVIVCSLQLLSVLKASLRVIQGPGAVYKH